MKGHPQSMYMQDQFICDKTIAKHRTAKCKNHFICDMQGSVYMLGGRTLKYKDQFIGVKASNWPPGKLRSIVHLCFASAP